MTKSDLIKRLCDTEKLSTVRAEALVNAIFDGMADSLRRGERVELRGFGSFEVRDYKPYIGRNPHAGTSIHVKAKRSPFFKVGKELRARVNGLDKGG